MDEITLCPRELTDLSDLSVVERKVVVRACILGALGGIVVLVGLLGHREPAPSLAALGVPPAPLVVEVN